jgi:transposase, IS5 family
VIKLRHQQPSLWHKGLAKDIEDLWEPWVREVDQLLEDAALVEELYQAQGKRHPKSQTRGRTQTPAVLRLLILQLLNHFRPDSLSQPCQCLRIRHFLVSDARERAIHQIRTHFSLQRVVAPVPHVFQERVVELARERGVVQGRKMRVDTTHYPTDSSLLGGGARAHANDEEGREGYRRTEETHS